MNFWPFNGNDTDELPPKPDPETHSEEHEFAVYEVALTYRNGDTETFECYGRYQTGADLITYNTKPRGRPYYRSGEASARYTFDRRRVNYEVLAREPVEREIGSQSWVLSWRVEWEKKWAGIDWRETVWVPNVVDVTMEPGEL